MVETGDESRTDTGSDGRIYEQTNRSCRLQLGLIKRPAVRRENGAITYIKVSTSGWGFQLDGTCVNARLNHVWNWHPLTGANTEDLKL